ncbi:MAG TPA: hypothetical protein VIK56_09335 [Rhodoferax sp.]
MAKIKGITLELGGEEFVVPPLPLGALESLQDRITGFTGGLDKGSVATVIDCLHASLKRNYPSFTREEVANLVDVANMGDVMQAVMDVSGMRRKQLEAEAAGNLAASTGAASTPASSPIPASPPT